MTLIHIDHDLHGLNATGGSALARLFGWLRAALRTIHQAIVTAKLERMEAELTYRRWYDEEELAERDATRAPQRPLILGDKWDF